MKRILLIFVLCISCVWQGAPTEAGLWIRPLSIKQGEVVIVSGLFYPFGNKYSFLGDCYLNFENKKYPFFREILSYEEFRNSAGKNGFQFISRLPTTPLTQVGQKTVTLECPTGVERFQINVASGNFPLQNIQLTASKNSLSATDNETQSINQALATNSPYKLWDSSKAWLLPNTARKSSVYGLRRTYNGKLAENYFHKGLDFAAFTGGIINAPARGKVILVGKEKDGFAVHGNCLFIDHGQGVISAYLHLSAIDVALGQEVQAGQLLGKVGDTGIATGPHLHFGLYVNGLNVNPEPWLQYAIP
jgi:murein DD-endopeptidase MepM/ murein hydrolase activator NlpD